LSGGGSNGAWEAGVLWGLLHNGNPADYQWDHITGISAGSINTAGLAGWAVGDEVLATEWLSEVLANMRTSDVWIEYPEGPIKAFINRPSLIDTSPFIPFLTGVLQDERLSEGYKRNFTIGTVNVETGEFTTFNRENVHFGEELATAAVCSSSIPIVFPPTHFRDSYFIDGGTVWDVNISSAINGCLDLVDD
jgi:predicted acylesterase/phospholipase RssA